MRSPAIRSAVEGSASTADGGEFVVIRLQRGWASLTAGLAVAVLLCAPAATATALESYNKKEYGELKYFAGDLRFPAGKKVYIQPTESNFQNLLLSDTSKLFVITGKQKGIILNASLKLVGQMEYKSLFFHYASSGEYKFLVNGENVYDTVILNKENKSIAEIEASGDAKLIGKTLYDTNETKFIEIDLSDVIKN